MVNTPTFRKLLLNGKTRELSKSLKKGSYFGCMTYNQSLKSFLERDLVTRGDTLRGAHSPGKLNLELRGISNEAQRHFGGAFRR